MSVSVNAELNESPVANAAENFTKKSPSSLETMSENWIKTIKMKKLQKSLTEVD